MMERRDIEALLYELALSENYVGFRQLVCALELAAQSPQSLCMVTKWLYPQIARRCGASWSAVERNLRRMTERIWRDGRPALERLSGRTFSERPSTAQFLAILLHILQKDAP